MQENKVSGLRNCIEQYWLEDEFVVLKVDLITAFNMVPAVHFPELLPWATW